MSDETNLTDLEISADAEAEASREERSADSESDAAALAEEVGAVTSDPDEDALEEADSAPTPPAPPPAARADVGHDAPNHSNRGSRKARQLSRRGR